MDLLPITLLVFSFAYLAFAIYKDFTTKNEQ